MHEVCVFNGDQELVDRSFQLPCADKKRLSVPSLWVIGDKAIANHFFEFFQCKEVHVSDQSQLLSDESGVPFEQVAMCVWLLPTFASFAGKRTQPHSCHRHTTL